MSCMTSSSKTWTQVNMIVKNWQPPQIWNPTFFFQDLAVPQVLKCYIFLQPHVPKPWQWLLYSRLGFPSLETFRGKAFQHYRPLPRIMSFMTWSSKTWTHLELFFQDLAATVLKSCMFSRLGIPSFEMFFCNSMSPSLDNDCTIQDLAFQLLKPFGPKNFNSISKNYAFSAFVFQDMNTSGNIFKTWQTKFGNLFSRLGIPSFEMLHFLQHHVPKSWQWLRYSRLGFPSLETFRGKEFQHQTLATNYVFHDLVFQDMNTSEHDCQDLAATTVLKSYIFLSRLGNIPCLELLLFCNSMSPRLDNDCPIQDLAFQVLKLSGKDFQH